MKAIMLLLSIIGLCVSLHANAASVSGYPCNVTYYPPSPNAAYGEHGYFQVVLEEGKNCEGTSVGYFNFCSTGASSTNCTTNSTYHYDADTLRMLFSEVRSHLSSERRVVVSHDQSCSYNNCGTSISFWANAPAPITRYLLQ